MKVLPRIAYLLARYRSHRRAGLDNIAALRAKGVTLVDQPAQADIVIIHDEPWTYPDYLRAFPAIKQRHVIAYAVWEPDRLNDNMHRWLSLADEVWTCSAFCRDILAQAGPPVAIVPHIVKAPVGVPCKEQALRQRFAIPEGVFVFYAIGKLEERKNIETAIHAFASAFRDGQARFIVKTLQPLPPALAATPGVVAWDGDARDDEIAALHGLGHCLVSAHCAEGWGLCLSDAMAHGNLVIATGYGGNMEFMDDTNAMPVAFTLDGIRKPMTRQQFGFAPDDDAPRWAYIVESDLTAKLRMALDLKATAPLRARARNVSAWFSPDRIGTLMAGRLRHAVK